MRRLVLVLLVVVTLAGTLPAQEASAPVEAQDGGLRVTAQLDPARLELGVPTTLTLTAAVAWEAMPGTNEHVRKHSI